MCNLSQLYDECRDLGVINSQKAFSVLCGKQPSWFSSTQARRRVPSTESLVTLFVRLGKVEEATKTELSETDIVEERDALAEGLVEVRKMLAEVWAEIVSRAD